MPPNSKTTDDETTLLPARVTVKPEPALLHRSLTSLPHNVISARGSYLTLDNGDEILDACSGAAVAIIGHGNTEVREAAVAQMDKVSYVHTMQYGTNSADDLASFILSPHSSSPTFSHGLVRAYFVGSGSEANDAAVKCGRQYWFEKGEPQRKVYVARRQAYHGGTIGAMSISGMPARKVPYDGITMPNVEFVGAPDAFHRKGETETEEQFVERLIREIEDVFERVGPQNVISFM
jgi:adenosylmethionine-8-amino-7-oxononanoate aminotransferase